MRRVRIEAAAASNSDANQRRRIDSLAERPNDHLPLFGRSGDHISAQPAIIKLRSGR